MTSPSISVKATNFPNSIPSEDDHFFSISAGNSWLHWSFHNSIKDNAEPSLFWRTPLLTTDDLDSGDLVECLSSHIPNHANVDHLDCTSYPHDHIFGKDSEPSIESAATEARSRKSETFVYIVSTNDDQIKLISKMFEVIPSQVFHMKGDDFFPKSQGSYSGIGIDRLATLYGAARIHGFPALVFDGGTAMTYTAADSKGHVIGGGISPGLSMRFQSLSEGTASLPNINLEHLQLKLQKIKNSKNPMSVFARNTEDAMFMTTVSEISNNGWCVIRQWLKLVGSPKEEIKDSAGNGHMTNLDRIVMVTGGSASVVAMLLKPDSEKLLEFSIPDDLNDVNVTSVNNLIHFGIAYSLHRFSKPGIDKVSCIDKRVALPDAVIGKKKIRRGVVNNVQDVDGIEYFNVIFDDGGKDKFPLKRFREMEELFVEIGEEEEVEKVKKEKNPKEMSSSKKVSKAKKPKKPKESLKRSNGEIGNDAQMHSNVAKYFDSQLYFGKVTEYFVREKVSLWHIVYDDGDEEDFDKDELAEAIKLYEKMSAKRKKAKK